MQIGSKYYRTGNILHFMDDSSYFLQRFSTGEIYNTFPYIYYFLLTFLCCSILIYGVFASCSIVYSKHFFRCTYREAVKSNSICDVPSKDFFTAGDGAVITCLPSADRSDCLPFKRKCMFCFVYGTYRAVNIWSELRHCRDG